DHVLDVGCGTGVLTLALAERGCRAVGTDASEPYLEGARRHRSHPAVTYELGDARRMHYAFAACVSTLAIDVIPEVDQVAAEMRRVTRPGGIVACAVFDFWGGFSAEDLVLRHRIGARRRHTRSPGLHEGAPPCVGKRSSAALAQDRADGCGGSPDRPQLRLQLVRGLLVQLLDRPD